MFNIIRSQVRPGMTAVDIGANVGDITHCLADALGPTGRVYAIEPCAATVEAGQAHQRDFTTASAPVTWLTYAMGRADGPGVLYHSDECTRHSLYRPNVIGGGGCGPEEAVQIRSLNSLQASGELPRHINFIKVDAQGAEDEIFAGASALLAAGQTIWILEIWPQGLYGAGSSLAHLVERLRNVSLEPAEGFDSWEAVLEHAAGHQGHSSFDLVVRPS